MWIEVNGTLHNAVLWDSVYLRAKHAEAPSYEDNALWEVVATSVLNRRRRWFDGRVLRVQEIIVLSSDLTREQALLMLESVRRQLVEG